MSAAEARAQGYMPPFTAARGVRVNLNDAPGVWSILDKAPGRGRWWVVAADDEAKAHCAGKSTMREAATKEMSAA